jgi:hypothetical protein
MTGMRTLLRFFALAAALAVMTSCGDAVRTGRSPVYLVIDTLQAAQGNHATTLAGGLTSDVLTFVTTPAPCTATAPCPTVFNDVGSAAFHLVAKDIGTPTSTLSPSLNNQVTITRYRVVYRRADGRKVEGVDVPFGFEGALTITVPASGSATAGFELVRIVAKEESPLRQLISSPSFIATIADVTFFGRDLVGNEINVTGSITIEFGNFGDT